MEGTFGSAFHLGQRRGDAMDSAVIKKNSGEGAPFGSGGSRECPGQSVWSAGEIREYGDSQFAVRLSQITGSKGIFKDTLI